MISNPCGFLYLVSNDVKRKKEREASLICIDFTLCLQDLFSSNEEEEKQKGFSTKGINLSVDPFCLVLTFWAYSLCLYFVEDSLPMRTEQNSFDLFQMKSTALFCIPYCCCHVLTPFHQQIVYVKSGAKGVHKVKYLDQYCPSHFMLKNRLPIASPNLSCMRVIGMPACNWENHLTVIKKGVPWPSQAGGSVRGPFSCTFLLLSHLISKRGPSERRRQINFLLPVRLMEGQWCAFLFSSVCPSPSVKWDRTLPSCSARTSSTKQKKRKVKRWKKNLWSYSATGPHISLGTAPFTYSH